MFSNVPILLFGPQNPKASCVQENTQWRAHRCKSAGRPKCHTSRQLEAAAPPGHAQLSKSAPRAPAIVAMLFLMGGGASVALLHQAPINVAGTCARCGGALYPPLYVCTPLCLSVFVPCLACQASQQLALWQAQQARQEQPGSNAVESETAVQQLTVVSYNLYVAAGPVCPAAWRLPACSSVSAPQRHTLYPSQCVATIHGCWQREKQSR